MPGETGLVARARGLLTHLATRETLESLAELPDLPAFVRGTARLGADLDPMGEPADIEAFERAVRRTGMRHLMTLGRWQREPCPALAIVSDDLDRKSVRRMIRGAMHGAPAAARLNGLSATRQLPERVLTELARQPSPTAVVGLLAIVGHPDAPVLAPLVRHAHPELFAIDHALLAGWADRARRRARRDDAISGLIRLRIDAGNIETALLMAHGPRDAAPGTAFVAGGLWLTAEHFVTAASAPTPPDALRALRQVLGSTPVADLLPVAAGEVDAIERAYLAQALAALARHACLEPMSSSAVLRTVLRVEVQGRDLRLLAWGATLGTPPAARKARLVTPWR